jgi:hypothetical protein
MTIISLKILFLENIYLDLYRPPRGLSKPFLNLIPNSTLQSHNYAIIYSLFNKFQGEEIKEAGKIGKVKKVGKAGKVGKVNDAQKINDAIT